MKILLDRIASILSLTIGGMALFAGGKVLIGKIPDYTVISWLPLYNYTMGLLIILIAAPLIWKGGRFSIPVAIGTLSLNMLVLIVLQTAFRGIVAPDSIQAMLLRVAVWLVILLLLFFGSRAKRGAARRHFSGEIVG